MFVSHACQLIIFPDPLGASLEQCQILHPWLEASATATWRDGHLYPDMPPREALVEIQATREAVSTYTKIAIVENPYKRLVRLYDQIVLRDPLWRLRRMAGIANPLFASWLENTKASGLGAGGLFSPAWRRFGAWSAEQWSGGVIDHYVRADSLTRDLQRVFRQLKVAPFLKASALENDPDLYAALQRYDSHTSALIRDRYRFDLSIVQDQKLHPVRVA
jgi:hypothetical protein